MTPVSPSPDGLAAGHVEWSARPLMMSPPQSAAPPLTDGSWSLENTMGASAVPLAMDLGAAGDHEGAVGRELAEDRRRPRRW